MTGVAEVSGAASSGSVLLVLRQQIIQKAKPRMLAQPNPRPTPMPKFVSLDIEDESSVVHPMFCAQTVPDLQVTGLSGPLLYPSPDSQLQHTASPTSAPQQYPARTSTPAVATATNKSSGSL
jgi:hypothetical protein